MIPPYPRGSSLSINALPLELLSIYYAKVKSWQRASTQQNNRVNKTKWIHDDGDLSQKQKTGPHLDLSMYPHDR